LAFLKFEILNMLVPKAWSEPWLQGWASREDRPSRHYFAAIEPVSGARGPAGRLGLGTVVAAAGLYTVAVVAATFPTVLTFGSRVPSLGDPLVHLAVMKWYKTCLREGRFPFLCPEWEYPVGAPIGLFSPMHLQGLLYLPLSSVFSDALCYNMIWFFGFWVTGLGTLLLAWQVTRDRLAATLAGLMAMLSGPMTLHARGHLELIYVGTVPLFLAAWLRLLERPSGRRLVAAAALYVLVAMSAAYFTILTVLPAGLAWMAEALRAGRGNRGRWLKERTPWLIGFLVLTLPGLVLLFAGHLWTSAHGFSLERSKPEFDRYGTSLWTYVLPSALHGLGRVLPWKVEGAAWSGPLVECSSYPGIVALVLLVYAAVGRVRFPRWGFWWATAGLVVVLSLGSVGRLGAWPVGLPASWLWRWFFAFRWIRVPARFNLIAMVVVAVIAAAALKDWLARLRKRSARWAVFGVLVLAVVVDLATVPFETFALPPLPACYAVLTRSQPGATFLEAPHYPSAGATLYAICGYWQSLHRGKTIAGCGGHLNLVLDNLTLANSPFNVWRLMDSHYLQDPESETFDLVSGVAFDDHVWLYLWAHQFDYVVLHQRPELNVDFDVHLDRLKARLTAARVYDDGSTIVYARARLRPPRRPTVLCTRGWRQRIAFGAGRVAAVEPTATLAVYNPEPAQPLVVTLEGFALAQPRTVRLLWGSKELACWSLWPQQIQEVSSPPFQLPAGLHELTLQCDGAPPPARPGAIFAPKPRVTVALLVSRVALRSSAPAALAARGRAARPAR
jgi:hypothetical protein